MMSDRKQSLLQKLEKEEIKEDELKELILLEREGISPESVLQSRNPEFVFLLDDKSDFIPDEKQLESFKNRLKSHSQKKPEVFSLKNLLAFAAVAIIACAITIPAFLYMNNQKAENNAEYFYTMKHRQVSEILPEIRGLLGENAEIGIDHQTGTIKIIDDSETLAKIETLLAELDVPANQYEFKMRFVFASKFPAIEQIDSQKTEKIELSKLEIEAEYSLNPLEGKKYTKVLDERYEVSFFLKPSSDMISVTIQDFRLYDRISHQLLISENSLSLSSGWSRIFKEDQLLKNKPGQIMILTLE